MDWLTYKFCVLISFQVLCVSKSQSQLQNSTSNLSNQLRTACVDGQPILNPDQCNSCICFAGQIHCTNFPCPQQDCVNGVDLPQPDACNKCICRGGKVTCSKMICIPAPHCPENQLYPAQNKCNACMCLKGFITCTNNFCAEEPLSTTIPTTTTKPKKKKKCTEGESLPGSNECIECFCRNGKKRCNNICNLTLENRFGEATTKKPKKKCIEGESLPGSKECIECFCRNGRKKCKYICNPTLESRFNQVPECVRGQRLRRPDDCNNCICFEGKIHCTHFPCRMDARIGLECSDDQPVFRPDECNECYCFEGRLECSDLVCIRGSKCVQGQVIPKPDSCNTCKCVAGHILCSNYQCPIPNSRNVFSPGISSTEVRALDECQEGDIISPPPPPNDCNTCYCMDNRILCTMNTCEGSDPEIKGRLREPNEQTDLEVFDKKISVEPLIHMLSKNYEKIPAKLIHTHAYNGFHQEIKVHANHLPKDATKLLKDLATSLDNADLASISQRLLASSNSLSNNHDSKIPLDHQVVKTNSLGEGNVLTTQSGKLITSGSQSNETILFLPYTEPFDGQNSQSVLPQTGKHETNWKPVPSPDSLVFNKNQEINPHSNQEEKLNEYYFNNPPSMFTPINQNNAIRNPSKFSWPVHPRMLPAPPARNTVHIPNTNPQSIYPASNPKSIYINDGKTTPIFRPGKIIVTPNNNDGQQKPSHSQFIPNLSKYYQAKPQQIPFKPNGNPTLNNKGIQNLPLFLNNPNQPMVAAKQPQFGLKPGQGSVSPLINIGSQTDQQLIAFPPNFQINPPLINISNQKKRISIIANEGIKEAPPYSMVPSSTAHHTNILNPPKIGVDPAHTQHKPSHSQFVPNPSVYYKNEYEAPKIIEVNPDQEQLIPHSKISYKHTDHYNPSHTSSGFGDDTLIPKVRNNATHLHYEKHTTITYVSEYDPTHSANQIAHDPNQHQNKPQIYIYEHYLPGQESQELDLTMSKVNYYLNLPNLQLDQNEPQPKLTHYYSSQTTNFPGRQPNYTLKVHPTVIGMNKYNGHDTPHQLDTYPHSPSNGKNTNQIKSYQNQPTPTNSMYPNIFANYPHSSSQPQFIPSQYYSKKTGGLNHPKSAEGPQSLSNSTEDPRHPKRNEHLPSPSQTGHTQNQHPPGVFDDRGSTNGFQYAHNAYEDPRQLKPVHKLLPSKLETPQNHQLPGFFDERGSADGFQYPSNSAEDHTHPKVKLNKSPQFHPYTSIVNPEQPKDNLHIFPHSQFRAAQNQHKPGLFDNRGVKDGFQYAHNADKNPTHLKPVNKLLPMTHSHTPFGPTLIQHSPGILDERASADGFQYPSNYAERPIDSRGNLHNPKVTQFGPTQNQHLTGMFHERGSADGFQYPSNWAEKPLHPKENLHKPPNSPFGLITYKQLPGMYPHNFAGNPTHPKNLTHPEQNKQKLLPSQVGPNHNKPTPGMFDGRGSPDGLQYSSNSPENPLHPKDIVHYPPHSQFGPPQNHHLPGVLHNRESLGSFQYPSNSAENPTHTKNNLHKLPQSQFLPYPNQHTPRIFDGRESANGFQHPFNSAENPTYPKPNKNIQPNSPFDPAQNQHLPGKFDERGSADGFQYPYNSAENPTHTKNNPNTIILESKFKQSQNHSKPSSSDDGYNHNNPLRPWMHLDHDQYKPSSFDNLLNGVHNIPWSFSGTKDSDTVTSAPKPKFTPDYDQYRPSSFDNLFNGIHQIPWSVPNQDNNALGSDAEITTSRSGFKPKQDQYGPSMVIDPSISNQNENIDLTDVGDSQLQIEQRVSTPSTDLTDSVSTQYNVLPKLKPDGDPDSRLPTDDGKIPDYYDQLYPLFKAVKKLSDPPIDDSVFSVGSIDQLDLLPFLFPGIAKILNYEPSQAQDDISPDESHVDQRNPLSKLKSKLKQLPENDNGILNWLKSKLNKLVPTKDNATVAKNDIDIDMTKIFNLLSKLTLPNLKDTAVLQNIPFSGFDPEIIENIMNDFKEYTLTTTPRTDSTHTYENRFKSVLTMPEESRPQAPPLKYPDVHIILHQPNDEDDVDFPPFIQTDGEINLPVDMDSEQLSTTMFPKMFNPRFRHRPKDQKEECGDGTQWTSNCHSCSCYFGQAMCVKLSDCELRPLGEPMTCKPYSHFKMGCYTCECNGDGVADCEATDCNTQPKGRSRVSGSTELPFYDSKKTNEILQFYNLVKTLPKNCLKHDLQTQYPTCERGTSWVSSCYKCECNQSGKHECIKIEDCKLDIDKYGKPSRCKPNSKFYPKTNSMPCVECLCNDEGISYCPAVDYKKH